MPDDVRQWMKSVLSALEASTPETPAPLSQRTQRGLFPGLAPVNTEGLFLIAPQGGISQRLGGKPEFASIVQWLQTPETTGIDALPSSVGALLTLAADRRIEIMPEATIKYEDQPETLFIGYSDALDPRLTSPVLDGLDQKTLAIGERLLGMPDDVADMVLRAMNLHYASVLSFDASIDAAYTLAVAGIEALTELHKWEPAWESWDQASIWEKRFGEIALQDHQVDAIKKLAMRDRRTRLGQRFVEYVLSDLPDDFWTEPFVHFTYQVEGGSYTGGTWSEAFNFDEKIDRDPISLAKRLKLTYMARSRHVHAGEVTGSFADQAFWTTGGKGRADRALPYAAIRSMLRWLILNEISGANPIEFPLRNVARPPGSDQG